MLNDDIDAVATLLLQSRHAVAFTGAGISTPSGIPDFRSPKSGIWTNVDPLAVASITGFRQNPDAFYDWIYPLAELTFNAVPNAAHSALADLEARGLLHSVITQNVDMLHTRAGSQSVFELHGHMREATCIHCFSVYDADPIIRKFLADRKIPYCSKCNNILKPNIILFGEQLPFQVMLASKDQVRKADLIMIIGTSVEVAPASDLPLIALRNNADLVILNIEETHLDNKARVVIHQDAAAVLPKILSRMETVR